MRFPETEGGILSREALMSRLMGVVSYGIGTIPGLILVGLAVEEKYLRVANYAINMLYPYPKTGLEFRLPVAQTVS